MSDKSQAEHGSYAEPGKPNGRQKRDSKGTIAAGSRENQEPK